jgi:HEAT repeat protein
MAAPDNGTEEKVSVPGIPESIAKSLDSPDAGARYRALEHWEATGTQAPLDPVFEAMEDEDEAVRAKAIAIAEKYWAAEQERERTGRRN